MGVVVSWLMSKAFPDPSPDDDDPSSAHSSASDPPAQEPPRSFTQNVDSSASDDAGPLEPMVLSPIPLRPQPPDSDTTSALIDISVDAESQSPPSSPPPTIMKPDLRITVPPPETPHWETEASPFNINPLPDALMDLCMEEEALSALERIYLYSQSNVSYHRVFIARALPSFLPQITAAEAIEYVVPLMNGLATDEDESVKEALVEDLASSIWWFLANCPLVDDQMSESLASSEAITLSVQSFTPLLGTLLLSQNSGVASAARQCIVNLLTRIRENSDERRHLPYPTQDARRSFEHELIQQVVIGLGHLDIADRSRPPNQTNPLTSLSFHDLSDIGHTPLNVVVEESGLVETPLHEALLGQTVDSELQTQPVNATNQGQYNAHPPATVAFPAGLLSPADTHHRSPSPTITMAFMQPTDIPSAEPMNSDTLAPWISPPLESSLPHDSSLVRAPDPERSLDSQGKWQSMSRSNISDALDDVSIHEQHDMGRLASITLMAAVTASGALSDENRVAFVKEVGRVVDDPVFWIRREAAFTVGALAKVVSTETVITSLLPLFNAFCDDSAWQVRQSVLFALPAFLSRLPPGRRQQQALKTILALTVDPQLTVRSTVFEVLGEVIYSFHGDFHGPPNELIQLFVDDEDLNRSSRQSLSSQQYLAHSWHNYLDIPRETALQQNPYEFASGWTSPDTPGKRDLTRLHVRAFNFPAVILTLGRERWGQVRGFYLRLANETSPRIRRTLAASLGEVANIIGPDNSRNDLIDIWYDYIRSPDSAVKSSLVECMELFMRSLHHDDRLRIFQSLADIWKLHLYDWHQRETVVKALYDLAGLFMHNLSTVVDVLKMLMRLSLEDSAAAVREGAATSYANIYKASSEYPDVRRIICEEMKSLAHSEISRRRVTYIACIQALASIEEHADWIIESGTWNVLYMLSSDDIVDVRIGVARLLRFTSAKYYSQEDPIPANILDVLRKLSEDEESVDARCFASAAMSRRSTTTEADASVASTLSATFSRPPPAAGIELDVTTGITILLSS